MVEKKKKMKEQTTADPIHIGENVRVYDEGEDLVIRIAKGHRGQISEKGNTRVASTLGNVKTFDGIIIGLNAYVKPN